jgi:hypothetical protein
MMTLKQIRDSSGEFTPEDAKELRGVLGNKSVIRGLRKILLSVEERDKLSQYELNGQEGLSEALRVQGDIRGMRMALEQLLNLTLMENEENA